MGKLFESSMKSAECENVIAGKNEIVERPRICCLDLSDETLAALKNIGLNIYAGSLGAKIKMPNVNISDKHYVLLNCDFPPNIHEYDIVIMDLEDSKEIGYDGNESFTRITRNVTGKVARSLVSSFPETLFDPKPFSCNLLKNELHKIKSGKFLVIAFSSAKYEVDYEIAEFSEMSIDRKGSIRYSIYSFWDDVPLSGAECGREVIVAPMRRDLSDLFRKYMKNIYYNQTFFHPTIWDGENNVLHSEYFPLLKNIHGNIVSYAKRTEKENLIIFPQVKDKAGFLTDFLGHVAPNLYPELFPFSTEFCWKDQEDYWLPNHSKLLKEKSAVEEEFGRRKKEVEDKISSNLAQYSFLHELISESGDKLVSALVHYFEWLEFEKVVNCDKVSEGEKDLEEDIQIEFDKGLLVVEVKGVGGTSTDSDCSQISKIKYRRCKERDKFDVFALYIVNHQRYLPPLKRQNPPFSENQIQDAKNDERGLLATWQLFNLYFDIENGIFSKKDAREMLLQYGLIDFIPDKLEFVYNPKEILKDGKVCIVETKEIELSINEEIFIEKNGKYKKATILDIQDHGKSVPQTKGGDYGLLLDVQLERNSSIWKKRSDV